jgi:hypothetical protein
MLTIHWVGGRFHGHFFLLLLLALFKPEPGFGVSISTKTTSSFPLGMFPPDIAAVWRKSATPNPRRTAVTSVIVPP